MPRRTADANKAVLAAWEREQALVREGKGTRDWTPEQQKDILDPDRGRHMMITAKLSKVSI